MPPEHPFGILSDEQRAAARGLIRPDCSDCGDVLTVAEAGNRRYCRVDAGRRMAAGEEVTYDQDPADGEPPRLPTDCRGSGIYDCPCEADGPDGLCSCCRSGERNGSCAVPAQPGWPSIGNWQGRKTGDG